MELNFVKMSGAGNDFIVFDNRDNMLTGDISNFIQKICHRRFSIGSDGILMVENSPKYDFRMRYFNADGGEAEMCGNGGRCIAKYAFLHGIVGKKMTFESVAGVHHAEIIGEDVKLGMTQPFGLELNFELSIDNKVYSAHFLNTGVPHVIIFVDDLEMFDVHNIGRIIRYHPKFKPAGTNANFVQILDDSTIRIRTYERGVEEETLACGTGATAAAILAFITRKVSQNPITVTTQGGFDLKIFFDISENKIYNVYLQGNAEITFKGIIDKKE